MLVNLSLNSGRVLERSSSSLIFKPLKQWFTKFGLGPSDMNMDLGTTFGG